MAYIISTVNMKGGVGKTTLTVNLATCLAKYHHQRVLIVDLDTQVNATLSLMPPTQFAKLRQDRRTFKQLITKAINPAVQNHITIHDTIQAYMCNIKGLDIIPGDIDMYDEFSVSEMLYERAVFQQKVNFERVWNQFERSLVYNILYPVLSEYDFIILDCAPGYNILTRSALTASDFYLLPAKPEPLSLIGIQLLERRLKKLIEAHEKENPINIEMLGIVFTMTGGLLSRYYRQVMQRVYEDYGDAKVFDTRIPADIHVSKAVDTFMPVVLAYPNTAGAKSLQKLTEEMVQKLQVYIGRKEQRANIRLSQLE